MKILQRLTVLALLIFPIVNNAQNIDRQDISIFPKSEKGYKQIVIDLPHSDRDNQKKVEIYVGKYMETDNCNRYFLAGELVKENLKGFGYNYFIFKTEGNIGSTMMACSDKTTKYQFVSSNPTIENYNGRLPIVIYVPEEYDVQYKIYQTTDEVFKGAVNKSK